MISNNIKWQFLVVVIIVTPEATETLGKPFRLFKLDDYYDVGKVNEFYLKH